MKDLAKDKTSSAGPAEDAGVAFAAAAVAAVPLASLASTAAFFPVPDAAAATVLIPLPTTQDIAKVTVVC